MVKARTWRPQLSMVDHKTPRTTISFSEAWDISEAFLGPPRVSRQQTLVYRTGTRGILLPGKALGAVVAELVLSGLQIFEQRAGEVRPDLVDQIEDLARPEDQARLTLDDVLLHRADVGDDDRET